MADRDHSGNYETDYARWGVEPAAVHEHGQFDESLLVPFEATKWWMVGNVLHAEGNHGHLAHTIPTDYICKGMDENGLPILVKISDHQAERKKSLPKRKKPGIKKA